MDNFEEGRGQQQRIENSPNSGNIAQHEIVRNIENHRF
jgi:hypothetical protein